MRWISTLSERPQALRALEECVAAARAEGAGPPDAAFLFPSAHHAAESGRLSEELRRSLGPRHVLGCSGGGVIGGGKEVEQRPALGLVCAWLPGATLGPFRLSQDELPSPDAPPRAWRERLGGAAPEGKPAFLILSDPFSLDPEELSRGLDYAYPGSVKMGGLSSGASRPRGNALFLEDKVLDAGAVGLALGGDVAVDPIVAQGCRPVGQEFQVTRCERNVLLELGGKRALEALQELFEALPAEDQELARTSLFLGLLNDPLKSGSERKDFLIRNLMGLDPKAGSLAVGAYLRPGQTVQFHVRDGRASASDLARHLESYRAAKPATEPKGALLFSCLGRGQSLYGRPNHDSDLFRAKLGPLAVGGFFCNGEIGPVDGATYLHGYTSCFGIFRPKT